MYAEEYLITIKQPLFSKARPRLTRSGRAYMPAAYKEAQSLMRNQIREQWDREPLQGPLSVHLEVAGEGRGDLDNIAGAFLDSAQGIVFTDDRVSVINVLHIEWQKAKKADSIWRISICPLYYG